MSPEQINDAQYLMRKIVTLEAAEVSASHPWLRESDRWNELVVALLGRVTQLPESKVRGVVDAMSSVGLLNISDLARIRWSQSGSEPDDVHAKRILEFLVETGVASDDARRGFAAICEAAQALQQHYQGKVQHYLRHYGELMLRDMENTFKFSALSGAEAKYAFTYWLQNVLNMPLSLRDEHVRALCELHHVDQDQWVAAADELDVNIALVDDLVQRYVAKRGASHEKRNAYAKTGELEDVKR